MRRRIMIIGGKQSGKSTVANWLNDENKPLKKRQDAIYGKYTIDVPAAYLENTHMYKYIFSLAQTARMIIFVVDGQKAENVFSPNFAQSFSCLVVGMIKKVEGISEQKHAEKMLQEAGVYPPYLVFEPEDTRLKEAKKKWLAQLEEKG